MSLAYDSDEALRSAAIDYCRFFFRGEVKFGIFVRSLGRSFEYPIRIGEVVTKPYPDEIPEIIAEGIFRSLKRSRLEKLVRHISNIEQVKRGESYWFILPERYEREAKKLLGLD
jgi:hypothetical protein